MRDLADQNVNPFGFLSHDVQSETKKNGEKQNLENFPFRKCSNQRVRYHVDEKLRGAFQLALTGDSCDRFEVKTGRIHVHSSPRTNDIDNQQPDYESHSAEHFEVQE